MIRKPLPKGFEIAMDNGSTYIIQHLIGEGGFSLIYSADTAGGTTSVVIKEFFPAEGAYRDSKERVIPCIGYEERFQTNLSRFENEGKIGGTISEASFQTVPFLKCGNGYAVMKRESDDMVALSDIVEKWNTIAPIPSTGNLDDRDPVFPDLVRVRYSLRIIESILAALDCVHEKGYLHLDINSRNVIWAGRDIETGENCEAFLADFGCSVEMNSGEYYPEYQLSYSPGFAAPEVQRKHEKVTTATDLYSVGVLLFYLCVGENALEITHNRKRKIQRDTSYLAIPKRICVALQKILIIATNDELSNRYQTANGMLSDIRFLRNSIPLHPINPDNTKSFTLFSLKHMLTGSEETCYSWIDELRDRRSLDMITVPESANTGLSWKEFKDDVHFLKSILPEEIFLFLMERVAEQPDKDRSIKCILSCNYDFAWKKAICKKIEKYRTRRLLEISRSLLNDEKAFFVHQKVLFQLLGKEGERLRESYYNCSSDIRKAPYVGLAMFTLFALLGPDGFKLLLPSPTKAGSLFFAL